VNAPIQPNRSLALLTDLYEITMAGANWKSGTHTREAVFHLFFRRNPFAGGYAIACGLEDAVKFLRGFRFEEDDVSYLAGLKGNDESPLFETAFLDYLRTLRFTCDVDGIPEGTVVFANEPLLRITGPIVEAQLVESALLNIINFQTLIATKAACVCSATRGDPVIEFGLRRAQGVDGALSASRAAFIGGCAGTSNVLAAKIYGIPAKGTHAHSWVMSFDSEMEAFQAYAEAMPNNCIFLVDTYDTLNGVRHAIEAGKWLRARGKKMIGIRLDSGDLAYLSIEARKLLDDAGFDDAVIVASNDLDETIIASLKDQGSTITVWGVGTKLVTAYDQPALGGVYKLTAVREKGGQWKPKIKISEQIAKVPVPGIQQVRRFEEHGGPVADVIYDVGLGCSTPCVAIDPADVTRRKVIPQDATHHDLLGPIFRAGKQVYELPPISESQNRTREELRKFHPGIKRLLNPHQYPVGLEERLHELKANLVLSARGLSDDISQ
jgi:nicotinate phosphoribosyltransferase